MIDFLNDIKRVAVALLFIFNIVNSGCSTCHLSDADIVCNAKKYNAHSSLTAIIEGYSLDYYTMPLSKKELIHYWNYYKKTNDGKDFHFWFESEFDGLTPERYLKEGSVYFVSYKDSCFLFDAKRDYGCCVYGTPAFWANTDPWKHLLFGNAYSFLDLKGRPVYDVVRDSLTRVVQDDLKTYRSKYDRVLLCETNLENLDEKFWPQASFVITKPTLTPFSVAFHYSRKTGLEYTLEINPDTSFQEFSKATGSTKSIDKPSIQHCINQGIFQDYSLYFRSLLEANRNIHDVFFLSPVVYDQSVIGVVP